MSTELRFWNMVSCYGLQLFACQVKKINGCRMECQKIVALALNIFNLTISHGQKSLKDV